MIIIKKLQNHKRNIFKEIINKIGENYEIEKVPEDHLSNNSDDITEEFKEDLGKFDDDNFTQKIEFKKRTIPLVRILN